MSKPDEKAIERDYCAGVLSQQEVADKYGITIKALRYKAEKNGWVRVKVPASVRGTKGAKRGKKTGAKNNKNCPPKIAPKNPLFYDARESISEPETLSSENNFLSFEPAEFGLSEKQGIFAENVAAGKKLVEAYRLAGYEGEDRTAHSNASRMLRNARVYRAVSFLRDKRQQRLSLTEDEIIHQLSAIASANPNELIQFRRVNCRHCWGERHLYQWRDIEEFDKAAEKASNDGKEEPEYGGLGFVETGFPNEDCPKCNGEGETQLFVADTSQLEGDARWLYAGIKQTQNGLEVRMANQEAARRDLLKIIESRKNWAAKKEGQEPEHEENDITDEQLNDALRSLGYGRFSDQLSDREALSDDQE
ncbi:terminase small subunit [Kosakonia sacchari]|uniref:terminase small subunit n=1 Tax=Kosakonia sacchari TaxID=1158459 RepID=UPI002ACD8661|nr:terminase small subunit [Kosakonia sacchari]MDZ7320739.1 terminase small subunit [Kosakonia sacchari]